MGVGNSIDSRLKFLREQRGLTLEALAKRVKSTRSHIWNIENKEVTNPSVHLVYRLAVALNTTVEYLIGEKHHSDCDPEVVMRRFDRLSAENKIRLLRIMEVL